MSEVHYFPRYSQPENVVTNNTLLFLLRLHQYNRFKFEKFVGLVSADEESQLSTSWLQFRQQKGTGKSIVDGYIAQDSVKIAVETKLSETFDPGQLTNHLALFGNEQHKLLILLTPSLRTLPQAQLARVREVGLKNNIQVIHTSFEAIVVKARESLSEHDEEMLALVDDYESFCSEMDLMPTDEYTLFAPPCRLSFEANNRYRLYYCPEGWSRRNARYLGIYANRSIRAIGRICKVVSCGVDLEGQKIIECRGRDSVTLEEQNRILGASIEAQSRGWDLTSGHKFYLCDGWRDTDFQKTSRGGIQGHRYFDLQNVLDGKVPTDIDVLAEALKRRTWE